MHPSILKSRSLITILPHLISCFGYLYYFVFLIHNSNRNLLAKVKYLFVSIQPPDLLKKHLSDPCTSLAAQSSNVLKELATSAKAMKKSSTIDFLVSEMNSGVEELRNALQSFPNQYFMSQASPTTVEEAGQDKDHHKKQPMISTGVPLMELMPLVTVASLLIEIAARIEGVVSAVNVLAESAHFKFADGENPVYKHPNEIDSEKPGQELASLKTVQGV